MTKEEKAFTKKMKRKREEDITDAREFLNRHYPQFWDRIEDEDITHLLVLGHALFKTDPQLLEATKQIRELPTQ